MADSSVNRYVLTGFLAILAIIAAHQQAVGQQPERNLFEGEKTSWHGFDRYDFLMDEGALTVKPIKDSPNEGTGINHQVAGNLRCLVIVPKVAARGKPWSWRGRYFDHEPQAEIELLKRGFHIGFIESDDMKYWTAWYTFLTEQHELSKRPGFGGMSGGGRNAFNWATAKCRQGFMYLR
jgi:hypothetical protein